MGTGFRIHVCMLPPSKNSILTDAVFTWRREWDSNPRGARTPNGFQDRLVMTTSISLQDVLSYSRRDDPYILSQKELYVNNKN